MIIRQAGSRQIAKKNRREESMKDRAKRMVADRSDRGFLSPSTKVHIRAVGIYSIFVR